MPHEQPTDETDIQNAVAPRADVRAPQPPVYESYEQDEQWLQDAEELPPRPRRRVFGAGGNPVALALLGVLLLACGFIGGVLVEKGETSSSSGAGAVSGLASRFAALRAGASGTGGRSSTTGGGSGFAAALGGGARPTAGTVAYLAGSTLYVTNSEDDTIKVNTSAATSVTKTVKASVSAIHPGETVTVTGTSGSGGSLSAESIGVGSTAGGGLAALFGASRLGARSGTSSSGGDEPSLFGGGG